VYERTYCMVTKLRLSILLKKFFTLIVFAGLPLVNLYHEYTSSIFCNMEIAGAKGFERIANTILVPTYYCFAGKKVHIEQVDGKVYCDIRQKFNYQSQFAFKTLAAIAALPVSIPLGYTLKAIAMLDPKVRQRYLITKEWIKNGELPLRETYYKSVGINTQFYLQGEELDCQNYKRRPEDSFVLSEDKRALKAVVDILAQNRIIFWADCGTCLGSYRYGGIIPWDFDIDLAILEPDFDKVYYLLKRGLDSSKYVVQDWSGRDRPDTYLKVYCKKSHTLIDIFLFRINEKNKTIRSVLSNELSIFLPESWKIRERRYIVNTPFDMVFPLKKGYFDGICIPVPAKTKPYLQARYGENIEPNFIYNEKNGRYEKDIHHPYWQNQYVH